MAKTVSRIGIIDKITGLPDYAQIAITSDYVTMPDGSLLSEIDWSTGRDGKSAYEVAVEAGFIGNEQEWLSSLKGEKGDAFTISKTYSSVSDMYADATNIKINDFILITSPNNSEENGRLYTKTKDGFSYLGNLSGVQGPKGDSGKSAYQLALDNGFSGTEQEWLDSLKADVKISYSNDIITFDYS